jgi:hypothetical protein
MVVGFVGAIIESGDYSFRFLLLVGYFAGAALVAALATTFAWIIEGFAKSKSRESQDR